MTRVGRILAAPALIFVAALATRFAAALFIFHHYFGPQLLFVQNESAHIASALVAGQGFSAPYANVPIAPTAQQPPLYPLLLAVIFKLFGTGTVSAAWTAVTVNILAGAWTALLLYQVGTLYLNRSVGLIAAWVWTLPWMYRTLAFSSSIASQYLAALGMTGLLLLLLKALKAETSWLSLGIYAGLMVLLQPTFLPVVALYGIWLVCSEVRSPKMWLSVVGLCLVLAPWTIRNYVQFGRFVPVRDNFGLELWLGNRPGMEGTVDYHGDFPDHDPATYARLGEIPFMEAKFQEAKQFILSNPTAFYTRCWQRAVEFWYIPYSRLWILISLLGWAGAILARRRKEPGVLLVIPLLAFPPVYYITHTFPTYRHPIDPVVILSATYAVVEFCTWLRFTRRTGALNVK